MTRGGKRVGAGRPVGVANRINQEAREKAIEGGETPLDYMLRVMRDAAQDYGRRDDMAKAAAPYVHARLANVDAQISGKDGGAITFTWQPPQG